MSALFSWHATNSCITPSLASWSIMLRTDALSHISPRLVFPWVSCFSHIFMSGSYPTMVMAVFLWAQMHKHGWRWLSSYWLLDFDAFCSRKFLVAWCLAASFDSLLCLQPLLIPRLFVLFGSAVFTYLTVCTGLNPWFTNSHILHKPDHHHISSPLVQIWTGVNKDHLKTANPDRMIQPDMAPLNQLCRPAEQELRI